MDTRTDSGSKHLRRRPPSRGQVLTRRRWRGEHGAVDAGHLLRAARATPVDRTSSSLSGVIDYDERFSARQIARWAAPLVLWWIVILAISIAVLDSWLADTVFGWYPESIRNMATFDGGGDTPATWLLDILFATALALNGVLGPVAEELYFRGHLLPRIDRFGRAAPVLNTVPFSIYHFWSPWQNLARVIGLLPWVFVVWRKRSVQLSIAVHVTANTIFLLVLVPAFV
jgi:uncharacterized protein